MLARLQRQPLVIFTTAYDQYAMQAFETNGVAYLLKPMEPTKLARAIDKIEAFGIGQKLAPNISALLSQLATKLTPTYPERISSRSGDRIEFIDLSRVTHFLIPPASSLQQKAAGARRCRLAW